MIKAFIDRIEENRVVLVLSDGSATQFDLPTSLLPVGAAPGDHVTVTIERALDDTAAALQTIQTLRTELLPTSDPEQLDFKL